MGCLNNTTIIKICYLSYNFEIRNHNESNLTKWEKFTEFRDGLRMIWTELPCSSWWILSAFSGWLYFSTLWYQWLSVYDIHQGRCCVTVLWGARKPDAQYSRKTYSAIIYVYYIHYGTWGLRLILSVYKYNRELNKTTHYSPFPCNYPTPTIVI